MWQQPQARRWLPSLVTLVFLAACSQAPPPIQLSEVPSPIATSPDFPTPSPLPSATTSVSGLPATDADQAPAIDPAPASEPAAKPAVKPQAPIAPQPAAKPRLAVTPTFQATPRMSGFSTDGNYFIYLESSRDTGAGIPKAALQLVNVASNRCVENGCIETRYGEEEAATETAEAETALLKQTWKVRQDLNLTPPVAGTDLPILSRARAADGTETVTVKPTDTSPRLQLRLRQTSAQDKAAMQLEVNYDGQQRSLDSLSNFRTNIMDYAIRKVTLSPDGKRVAVLITTTKPTFEGTLGTTLIQGFAL
ncbi:MAG TPA: DUF2259 domain-containing protein [Thermosynechococcaceae cyanobacterium]